MLDFYLEFKKKIKQESLVKTGDSLLLGVSGGPDSMAMLDVFCRYKEEIKLKIVVFHLNHCFRREAAREASFVEDFCQKRDILVITKKVDVPSVAAKKGLSPEEAARNVRLNLIKDIMAKHELDTAALAHNKNDKVETILFNLFRGTGLRGLKGIEPFSFVCGIPIIHPLLEFSREQIENYCQKRNLNPVRDPSNKNDIYTRNVIRNQLLPLIEKEINPAVKKAIIRMSSIIEDVDHFLEEKKKEAKPEVVLDTKKNKIELKLPSLKELSPVIRRRIFYDIISEMVGQTDDFYYKNYRALDDLVFNSETGKCIEVNGIYVFKVYEKLIISEEEIEKKTDRYCYRFPLFRKIGLPGGNFLKATKYERRDIESQKYFNDCSVCCCDYDKLNFPLKVRNRRRGDKIQPLGMSGHKKVKDILIDKKIPVYKRDLIPLIVDNEDNIIWIVGVKMDEKYKISSNTDKILFIQKIE